jgi:HEAT repeat protein
MQAWEWSYACVFLSEYYLATRDAHVLPAIREYATKIAEGQSVIGTWGHGMSLPKYDGGLGGYGAINQPGLTCWLAMILAQKCGVDDALVRKAVARSHRFFGFYTGKGSIPYGDHAPYWFLHDNNGKNGQAAIAFDLLGDAAGARSFSRMSTASYDEREYGHTGNYFGYLWGPPGVARSGRNALAAHLREQAWYYDLARSWDGGFPYPGGPGEQDSYIGWDMTGAFLLTYALPLRKLAITGNGMGRSNALGGAELRSVIAAGRGFDYRHTHDCFRAQSDADLLKALTSWSPAVRHRAAAALALNKSKVAPRLIAMLGRPELDARYGACHALELMEGEGAPAVDALITQLSHRDPWLQIRAAYALAGIGRPARRSVPALLRLALAGTPDDPRQTTRRYLGMALFLGGYVDTGPKRGLLADTVESVDTDVLIPVLKQMLATDDGLVRAQIGYLYSKLSDKELDQLWPDIVRAVEKGAPSGEMYANEVRVAGVNLLAKHHIREGIGAIVRYARAQTDWASENRTPVIMAALKTYGSAAKDQLPALRAIVEMWKPATDFPEDCNKKRIDAVEDAIRFIEAAREAPPLRSLGQTTSNRRSGRRGSA